MINYMVEAVNEANEKEWTDFCATSPQVTPFMRDDYLSAIGYKCDKFFVKKNEKIIVGLCLAVNSMSGQMEEFVPFAPYQGLLYRSPQNMQVYSFYKENLEATTVLLDHIGHVYNKKIAYANHYSVEDIRAISWYNYHLQDKGVYNILIFYTAVKNLFTDKDIVKTLSKGRKYDYKYSQSRYCLQYIKNICKNDIDDFMELYKMTFQRQDIFISKETMGKIKDILITTLYHGYGFLRYAETSDGKRIGAVFILYDKNCAYYLYGANHPEYRSYGAGTFLLVEAMKEVQSMGINYFDFVGANSPQRGDFKLSFGAELKPYYLATLNMK